MACLQAGIENQIDRLGADTIAAIIVEPIAFAGGVIVPPRGFLEAVFDICRKNSFLLIIDEVITGFGRSGRWFAFQWADGVRPDIVTMGKGITSAYFPLSAAAVSNEIYETFLAPGNAISKIITMAGHPVGCDIALKVIEITERDDLVGRVRQNSGEHLSKLTSLNGLPKIRDVRGLGHMWGVEFEDGSTGDGATLARSVADRCFEVGLLVLYTDNLIRINPPLTATVDEIRFVADTLIFAIKSVATEA